MTDKHTGAGEPGRTLALLWGEQAAVPRRSGPVRSVTVERVVDASCARMEREPWGREHWRRRLTAVAESNRARLVARPWPTEVTALSRPPLGPGVMARYEHEPAALDGTTLSDVDADAALAFLLGLVQSHCRSAHDPARATTDSARSDADWWAANQPILARAFDPSAFPRAVRIAVAAGAAQAGPGTPTGPGSSAWPAPSTDWPR